MALNKIFWSQIDAETIPIGEEINLGTNVSYINNVYLTDLWVNGVNIYDLLYTGTTIWHQTGSFYATTNNLQVTGSMTIKGDLIVEGKTTLVQNTILGDESLIVSGVMKLVKSEIESASFFIENLGTIADRGDGSVLDLGFF